MFFLGILKRFMPHGHLDLVLCLEKHLVPLTSAKKLLRKSSGNISSVDGNESLKQNSARGST